MTRRLSILLATVAAALLVVGVAAATAGGPKTFRVGDYFLSPSKISVKVGTEALWRWPTRGGDSHNVKLQSRPSGSDKLKTSEIATSDYRYPEKGAYEFTKAGKYVFVCTLHSNMVQ